MNYIWSKYSLLNFIDWWINKITNWNFKSFADLFAGTWIVWRYFKKKWYKIIANDIQYFSYVLNRHYIWNHSILEFNWLIKEIKDLWDVPIEYRPKIVCERLNTLSPVKWFIYENYSPGWTKNKPYQRLYFTDENAAKIDAIRLQIEKWKKEKKITDDEYYFLLTTLLEAADKVANTASVYEAFLKRFKKSALKPLKLVPVELIINDLEHEVYNFDINKFVIWKKFDVVYLDPPYNRRQYSSNYHILETIAKYDNPVIIWKTWIRYEPEKKSLYCMKSKVKEAFKDLINKIKANYIFLSYNDEWLLSLEEIKEILSKKGEYWYFAIDYSRFKSDKDSNRQYRKKKVIEYLHYVKIIG